MKNKELKGITLKALLYDIGSKLGENTTSIADLKVHFNNHLSNHKIDKLLQTIYFALILIMFAYLRWGIK